MESVVDSPAWAHLENIDSTYTFAQRNVRMGLSLDGLNPHSMKSSTHSTWPILILLYNLPLWLVSKNFFISLTILISGKSSPTNENIDVYLEPLMEELLQLWQVVPTFDSSPNQDEDSNFLLRGLLLWKISYFPAYGLISGQKTKGHRACPVCGPEIDWKNARGPKGNKIVYVGGRKFLKRNHHYRSDLRFNGQTEDRSKPSRMSGTQIKNYTKQREAYLHNGGAVDGVNYPCLIHGVKRLSTLYRLPYWKVSHLCLLTIL
jgi:hypothetical protein